MPKLSSFRLGVVVVMVLGQKEVIEKWKMLMFYLKTLFMFEDASAV